jgi:hypothetical protein
MTPVWAQRQEELLRDCVVSPQVFDPWWTICATSSYLLALSLMAVWFLIGETHRGQQWTPALTLPHVRCGMNRTIRASPKSKRAFGADARDPSVISFATFTPQMP